MGKEKQTHDDDRGEQNWVHSLITESHRDEFETVVDLAEYVSSVEHVSFRPERWIVVTEEHVVMRFDRETEFYETSALDGELAWVDGTFESVFVEFFRRLVSESQVERDYNPSMEETKMNESQKQRKDEIVEFIKHLTREPDLPDTVPRYKIFRHMLGRGYDKDAVDYDLKIMCKKGDRIHEPELHEYALINQGDDE